MNNFTEMNQEELSDVSGGFVISATCAAIIGVELALGAAAQIYVSLANKALDAKMGK